MSATVVPVLENRKPYRVLLGLPIGMPQVLAGVLLLVFFAECFWISTRTPLRPNELAQIQLGQMLLSGRSQAVQNHSLLVPVLAAMPLIGSGPNLAADPGFRFQSYPRSWRWRARLPFIFAGLLLGASLWYVSRRLFGTKGGFIALGLYAFTPTLLQRSSMVEGSMLAAWAAFGVIFTAIAVAHTMYAPRSVVLWNWKRTLLLGISLALAIAVEPALVFLAPIALAYLLFLVPERRRESLAIFAAAMAAATVLLLVLYQFHPGALGASFRGLSAAEFSPGLFARALTWSLLAEFFLRIPGVLLLLIASAAAFVAWKRPRYFGNSAPLLVWFLLMVAGIAFPFSGGYAMFVVALPFAFVFIAGVFVDLLETTSAGLVLGLLAGILLAHASVNLLAIAKL